MNSLNRRDALKSGLFGAAAAAGTMLGAGAAEAKPASQAKDYKFDFVVVGAGCAGLSAALEAADQGATVAVLEKMGMPFGNTIYAGGIFNASFVAVVQTRIDAGVLGRVMSLYYSFGLLPSAIGLLGTGFLAEQVGLTTTFVIAGLVICTLGLTAFCIPSVMRLDRQSKSAEHQTQATDGK